MESKKRFDLDTLNVEEFGHLSSEVVRRVIERAKKIGGDNAAVHDSHSSSHSKNSITSDYLEKAVKIISK